MNTTAIPAPRARQASIHWQPRQIPLSYGRHVTGIVPVALPALPVPYESRLERRAIGFLVAIPGLRFLQSQPFTLTRETDQGARRYTPDLLAVYCPIAKVLHDLGFEMWTVIEVKPFKRLLAHQADVEDRLRWVAEATGMATVCLTEREIERGGQSS